MSRVKQFVTEVALCEEFLSVIPKEWTPYAETAGWDILLARDDGFQVGIQAKLKLNSHVVSQTLEEWGGWSADRAGPDCRAVLVPSKESGFEAIAAYIGFTIIRVTPKAESRFTMRPAASFYPPLPGDHREWHEWMPTKRHTLPAYVPDVPAGASAPIQLTPWKIKALKLYVLAETRGFITRHDFKHLGLDHRPFISAGGWLRPTDERGRYQVHSPAPTAFKAQHARVYEEIRADAANWMQPTDGAPAAPPKVRHPHPSQTDGAEPDKAKVRTP